MGGFSNFDDCTCSDTAPSGLPLWRAREKLIFATICARCVRSEELNALEVDVLETEEERMNKNAREEYQMRFMQNRDLEMCTKHRRDIKRRTLAGRIHKLYLCVVRS